MDKKLSVPAGSLEWYKKKLATASASSHPMDVMIAKILKETIEKLEGEAK